MDTDSRMFSLPPIDFAHNSTRKFHVLIAVVLISAFGPYLVSSFRVEHFVIYPLAAAAVLLRWRTIIDRALGSGLTLFGSWFLLLLLGVIGMQALPATAPRWEYGSFPAGVDTVLLPFLVVLIMVGFAPRPTTAASLWFACRIIAVLGVLNGMLSVITMLIPDLTVLLRPFWGAEGTDDTVADAAMEMGRFSGVFNQPAEAGLFYSLAALSAIAVYAGAPLKLWPTLLVITVGGMLTVSKVFLFVGLPIALIYLFMQGSLIERLSRIAVVTVLAVGIFSAPFIQTWSGLEYLLRFADAGEQSVLELFTAGRWNEGSTLLGVFEYIYHASPLVGVGFRGLAVPYDSAWAEIVVFTGFLGVGLLIVGYLSLLVYSFLLKNAAARAYGLVLSVVLIGASFGISSLTLNRVSVLAWVVIGVIICLPKGETEQEPETRKVAPGTIWSGGSGDTEVAALPAPGRRSAGPEDEDAGHHRV